MSDSFPESKMAARLVQLRSLEPPIDVEALVRERATLHDRRFPMSLDMDGLCLNLKRPGVKPTVILNSRKNILRRRFTLAHELGHILIPWHTGNIFDITDDIMHESTRYWVMEAEANRFASELLMPTTWVKRCLEEIADPALAMLHIYRNANTSALSTAIKVSLCLKPGFVVARVVDGKVEWAAKSQGTSSGATLLPGIEVSSVFNWANPPRIQTFGSQIYYWWDLNVEERPFPAISSKPWREILDGIMADLPSLADAKAFKMSINGVIASINGGVRSARTKSAVLNVCLQRLNIKATEDWRYDAFLKHKDFEDFLLARISAFFEN